MGGAVSVPVVIALSRSAKRGRVWEMDISDPPPRKRKPISLHPMD